MTLTLELTPEQGARLSRLAARAGLGSEAYLLGLIDAGAELELVTPPATGAELIAYWQSNGCLGAYAGAPDSPDFARQLRAQAEARTW